MNAKGTSPLNSSGIPMTPASATSGWSSRRPSSSAGATWKPRTLKISWVKGKHGERYSEKAKAKSVCLREAGKHGRGTHLQTINDIRITIFLDHHFVTRANPSGTMMNRLPISEECARIRTAKHLMTHPSTYVSFVLHTTHLLSLKSKMI